MVLVVTNMKKNFQIVLPLLFIIHLSLLIFQVHEVY